MKFGKDYYISGNYQNYLNRKFNLLCRDLVTELGLKPDDRILDFGCGAGGLLYEFWLNGFNNIIGTDISSWIIQYGRNKYPEISDQLKNYNLDLLRYKYDYALFLDVLEHIEEGSIRFIFDLLLGYNKKTTIIARIPISLNEGNVFFLDVSNNDKTHINCHCREWWISFLDSCNVKFVGDIQTNSIYSSEGVLSGKWEIE